jgi:ABC-type branched-subunit amino acid transport system substrate-binding protein
MSQRHRMSRRQFLGAAASAPLVVGFPAAVRAQDPIRIGTLMPLTGGGGVYGSDMQRAVVVAAEQINQASGVLGRPIQLFHEDDQTNPDAGVRGARKLIDVNRVVAVLGTWSSAVTLAVGPICIQNRVVLMNCSGSEKVTELGKTGYLYRTQASNVLWGAAFGRLAAERGFKRAVVLAQQNPFAISMKEWFERAYTERGGRVLEVVMYNPEQSSYRGELTRAFTLKPEVAFIAGYTPDASIIVKDWYKAGYGGQLLLPGFAANPKFIENVGAEVAQGILVIEAAPAPDSKAFQGFKKLMGKEDLFLYSSQTYDQLNLVALAIQAAGEATGDGIRRTMRTVANPPGKLVSDAVNGIAELKRRQEIDYDGASGPCDFDENGDLVTKSFYVFEIRGGKLEQVGLVKG